MVQKKIETRPWDAAEHLATDEDMVAYLDAALEDGDTTLVVAVLGDIARAKGMSQIAREAGLGRESLYKALSTNGNPEFATILKVVGALGLQLHVRNTNA
jgi:probable addiction module antidote protein